jgi:hypothetical protein
MVDGGVILDFVVTETTTKIHSRKGISQPSSRVSA